MFSPYIGLDENEAYYLDAVSAALRVLRCLNGLEGGVQFRLELQEMREYVRCFTDLYSWHF